MTKRVLATIATAAMVGNSGCNRSESSDAFVRSSIFENSQMIAHDYSAVGRYEARIAGNRFLLDISESAEYKLSVQCCIGEYGLEEGVITKRHGNSGVLVPTNPLNSSAMEYNLSTSHGYLVMKIVDSSEDSVWKGLVFAKLVDSELTR